MGDVPVAACALLLAATGSSASARSRREKAVPRDQAARCEARL